MKFRKKERAENAASMKLESDKRTPAQKLARLDERLGEGVGAKKERARLVKQLEK